MATTKPIFRIFDYEKAMEFYVGWLGFEVDWEDKPKNAPVYLQISRGDVVLHLSEHHGDCSPGSKAYIDNFEGLKAYHTQLIAKDYKFNRPGLATGFGKGICMEVIDPFGNKLSFNESSD